MKSNSSLNVVLTYNVKPGSEVKESKATIDTNSDIDDRYAEWDSIETINAIKEALESNHHVTLVEANEDAFEKFRKLKPDIVFNFAECENGTSREAQIPAMLDMLQIPYTGSDPLTLATCLNKARTKEILSYHKIRNAKFIVAESLNDLEYFSLEFPVIVKPLAEGSSKGIFNSSIVNDLVSLKQSINENTKKYKQPFIIEEFLPGREFTAAIMGNNGSATVLPIVEVNFDKLPDDIHPIYSYEAKWIYDTSDNPLEIFTCPAELDENLQKNIIDIALKTFSVLNCKDWCRIDIRLDKNNLPNIIEVNPIPGILPNPEDNSCFPKAARANGMSYTELVNNVLLSAAKRHGLLG